MCGAIVLLLLPLYTLMAASVGITYRYKYLFQVLYKFLTCQPCSEARFNQPFWTACF